MCQHSNDRASDSPTFGLWVACYDRAVMNNTWQREHWDGDPIELGDACTLSKGEKVARCILVTHPLGWELRLMMNDLPRSQVCRFSEEILDTHEWRSGER